MDNYSRNIAYKAQKGRKLNIVHFSGQIIKTHGLFACLFFLINCLECLINTLYFFSIIAFLMITVKVSHVHKDYKTMRDLIT